MKQQVTMESLRDQIIKFAEDRDWKQFHSPKNLAMSVAVEASELLELFMWLTPEQSSKLTDERLLKVRDEVGDVLICLINFAASVGIDPLTAASDKLQKNAAKYPIDKSKGSAKKYDEL